MHISLVNSYYGIHNKQDCKKQGKKEKTGTWQGRQKIPGKPKI